MNAKKMFGLFGLLTALALLLAACGSLPWAAAQSDPTPVPAVTSGGRISAEGRVLPLRWSVLGFQAGGELGKLPVAEGDSVTAGDTLARLGKIEALQARLAQARQEQVSAQQAQDDLNDGEATAREQSHQALVDAREALNQAQIALNDLDTDDFTRQLDDRNIAMDEAQEKMDDAKDELDKHLDLDEDNATRKNAQTAYDNAVRDYNKAVTDRDTLQNQMDSAKAAVALAKARVDDAQRAFDDRAKGVDPKALALAQARVDAAKAAVTAAQQALNDAALAAPFAGTVADLHDLEPGEVLNPGQAVVTLADFSAWVVETRDLTELDVVNVSVGQAVEVTPDALPDLTLRGTVESIDQIFTERSGDINYTVRIRLEETDPRLRWGMTVNAVFVP